METQIIINDDDILNAFYKMIDEEAPQNNRHRELKELIKLITDETIIKLHLEQDINYLKYKFNIWRYFETPETRERAKNIKENIIRQFPTNTNELSRTQLKILYFPEIEHKKFNEIIIYDVVVGDIIKEYGHNSAIYSKVYKITKSYIFLESFKHIDIETKYYNNDRETIYYINFLDPIFVEKRKIFMRKPDPRHKPQTLEKLKDNQNYIIDKVSYYSD